MLSLWLSSGQRDDLLWRTSMSGGRATIRFRKGLSTVSHDGDLSSIDPLSAAFTRRFHLECKFYKDLQIASAFLKEKGCLYQFWGDLRALCRQRKKQPMLIAKENKAPAFVMVTNQGANDLGLKLRPVAYFLTGYVYLLDELIKSPSPDLSTSTFISVEKKSDQRPI